MQADVTPLSLACSLSIESVTKSKAARFPRVKEVQNGALAEPLGAYPADHAHCALDALQDFKRFGDWLQIQVIFAGPAQLQWLLEGGVFRITSGHGLVVAGLGCHAGRCHGLPGGLLTGSF